MIDPFYIKKIQEFMRESNWIEGETEGDSQIGALHKNDLQAAMRFLERPLTSDTLLALHKKLSTGRKIKKGAWRDCEVMVGRKRCPNANTIPELMRVFFEKLEDLDKWEAHNEFEMIHPFEDLNGRTGRLLWLHLHLDRGGFAPRSFLQQYYYQTLNHYELRKIIKTNG